MVGGLQIRNPEWEDWWVNRNSTIPRYFKGIVVDRNMKRPLPYKVRLTEFGQEGELEEDIAGYNLF